MIKSGKEKKDPFMLFKRMRITRAKKNRATIMSEKSPTFPSTIRYNQLQLHPKITSGFWVLP